MRKLRHGHLTVEVSTVVTFFNNLPALRNPLSMVFISFISAFLAPYLTNKSVPAIPAFNDLRIRVKQYFSHKVHH